MSKDEEWNLLIEDLNLLRQFTETCLSWELTDPGRYQEAIRLMNDFLKKIMKNCTANFDDLPD